MGFKAYLGRRVVFAIVTLFVVATLNFLIFQVLLVNIGIDPVMQFVGTNPNMTPEQIDVMYKFYGLREDVSSRYLKYLRNLFTFGLVPPYFGVSLVVSSGRYVASELAWRIPLSVLLLGTALVGRILIGIPLGIFAGSRRGTKADAAVTTIGLFTWGLPTFFLQILFVVFFVFYLHGHLGINTFPAMNLISNPQWGQWPSLAYVADVAWHLTLPITTLILIGFAGWGLYVRNLMMDALTQDYIVTARAKGLRERTVLYRHAFTSILPPIITLITLSIPGLITGAMITEYIFNLPGVGRWYLTALGSNDFPVTQAVLYVFAVLTIVCNFIADLLYGLLDPRIRVGARR